MLKLAKNKFKSKHRVNKITLGKIYDVKKKIEKILTKVLLDNQEEVDMTSQINPEAEQTMDDTFVPEVQIDEQVEVSVQEEVREEDAGKEEEGKEKVENPLVIAVNPLNPENK